jgi:large subunit ribosomal protein L1
MAKISKKRKEALAKHDLTEVRSLIEAAKVVKDITYTKFDASVDIDVRLGVDPRKADQMVRGVATLPHGTGKVVRVLALVTPDKEAEALAAGADFVGLDDYIAKIEKGWTDIDVIITMPAVMAKVGRLGRVLGPRGLMPNPKSGTVTTDVAKAVQEVKLVKSTSKLTKPVSFTARWVKYRSTRRCWPKTLGGNPDVGSPEAFFFEGHLHQEHHAQQHDVARRTGRQPGKFR